MIMKCVSKSEIMTLPDVPIYSEESTWIKPKELEHVVFNAPTKEELGKSQIAKH